MKKLIIYLLKPFSFLPAIAMMYLIFSFSSQTGTESGNLSHEISYQIVSAADRILDKNLSEEKKNTYADKIELPVWLAHMTECCILACVYLFLCMYTKGQGFWLFLLAGLLSAGFACTDEFHQSFVAGRGIPSETSYRQYRSAVWYYFRPIFCHSFTPSKEGNKKELSANSSFLFLNFRDTSAKSRSSLSPCPLVTRSLPSSRIFSAFTTRHS